ncbi:membrane protein [Secundilactobacillus pentosiphilus]|uniref:Membrane protein n=1 Tax=Secundilactobacillus pentosiphilus TaxID=1714682 RepID=A0A1Z5IYK0_9LACO|nr:phosphatase PAP2 family protein [Secundilactobacillus pentosiphilus]GAX06875.1 membrane protein [Secundilactobacillus pentosiphilus]
MQIRQQANRFWRLIALLTWSSFLILAVSVHFHVSWLTHFDQALQQISINVRQPGRTAFFKWLALLGTPTTNGIICLMIAGGLWLHHYHSAAGWVLTAQVGINILTTSFKMLLQRARPIHKLAVQGGYSFPSGHTTSTATMVLILLLIIVPLCPSKFWRYLLGVISIGWLVLMGFDRIYLFVHYPSDVLAGVCLALGWWSILQLAVGQIIPNQQE